MLPSILSDQKWVTYRDTGLSKNVTWCNVTQKGMAYRDTSYLNWDRGERVSVKGRETGLNIGNKIKYMYILFFLYYKIKEI